MIRLLALKQACACCDYETYLIEQTGAEDYIQTPQAKEILRL